MLHGVHKPNCSCAICKAKRGETKGENSYWYGKHPSEETCKKIGIGNTGKIVTEETKQKQRVAATGENNSMYGKHHTEETIQKLIISHTGTHHTEETIQKIRVANTGDKHPQWQGGISEQGYPLNFNNELKELIRERDNYTCQLCGKPQEEESKKLAVHHIDYVKENLDPNNLLTLCNKCNSKVNYNREGWTKFFSLKLSMFNQENVN